ncbi:ROK family protein [Candidatus Peregrinibacteria bacterium]|nr:ROK family protein [Candidatus Peregrinibacteria bacterium]
MIKKIKYIGLDVGGSKILIQTFDDKLNTLETKQIKTDTLHGKAGFLKQLYGLIDAFFSQSVKGIGVAVPGIVDRANGVLVRAPHLPTGKDLKLKSLLKKRYKTTVFLDNDINGFLAEESQNSALKKTKNILAVMVGTGVGGAAIVEGKLVYGKDGFAGEFGHMVICKSDKKRMTFEQNTSGHYLKKYPRLKKDLVENFGIGLSNLNLIFNPEVIVLGGSVYYHHLADKKQQLTTIIRQHSLAKQAPKLVDAGSRTSVAKGVVRLLIN